MKQLLVYIRGGLGDVWTAVSAVKQIMIKNNLDKFNVQIISDSLYHFRENYPKEICEYMLQMLKKITPNIYIIHPTINDNFWLNKNGKVFDDTTSELSMKEVDKYLEEFVFWRSKGLKNLIDKSMTPDTTFIDALFTECILIWNQETKTYEKINNDRHIFEFNPSDVEREKIDSILSKYPKHIFMNVRKKEEGNAHTESLSYYQELINTSNENDIMPILVGIDVYDLKGQFVDFRGSNVFSFEGMAYLIDKCKLMLGNDSGFTIMKMYQQQKDTLTIINNPRIERNWSVPPMIGKSNFTLYDAKDNNLEKIKEDIINFY